MRQSDMRKCPTVESNRGQSQAADHAEHGDHHDATSSNTATDMAMSYCFEGESVFRPKNSLNDSERHTGQDKVGAGHDERDSSRILEADLLKERTAEVHQAVEARQLLEGLETTGDDESPARGAVAENAVQSLAHGQTLFDLSDRFDVGAHHTHLEFNLLWSGVWIDFANNLKSLFNPAMA